MKYGERLKAARKFANMTQIELADKIGGGITQAGISYLENGDATGSEFTVQFAIACCVSPIWLALEQGDMTDSTDDLLNALSDQQIRSVVLMMLQMDNYQKSAVFATSNALAQPQKIRSNGTK